MRIEVIPQIALGSVSSLRVGDFLNNAIADSTCQRFRFAVAYMRISGLDRLGASIDVLLNRGGHVSGAVGVDEEITSVEALEQLSQISQDSTIFYTISGFIYHPKLYIMSGDKDAVIVIGSPNLTANGLFRNVEVATAIYLDFANRIDIEAYKKYDNLISELLNISHPNVQPINLDILRKLESGSVIKKEAQVEEPGSPVRPYNARRKNKASSDIEKLFPSIRVPATPPILKGVQPRVPSRPSIIAPPRTVGSVQTLMMQLSRFDSSHRTGVNGTTEALIPNAAVNFFPPRTNSSGHKYLDTYFNAVLNTETGYERHGYRFWYYDERSENRLRLDKATIDLSNPNGGDLLVINKQPVKVDNDVIYEITILPQTDPTFDAFFNLCTQETEDSRGEKKKWGLVSS